MKQYVTKLVRWCAAPDGDFFASCILSEPRAVYFRHTFYIRTKATPCVEVWQISSLRRLRLGEEKRKKERKKEETTGRKYNVRVCYAGRP